MGCGIEPRDQSPLQYVEHASQRFRFDVSIPSIRVARYQSKKAASALLRHVRSASLDRSLRHPASRMIARKDGAKVRLYSRPGNDLTYRFSLIVEALAPFQGRRNYSQPSEMAAP
jgi:hypothetical protein